MPPSRPLAGVVTSPTSFCWSVPSSLVAVSCTGRLWVAVPSAALATGRAVVAASVGSMAAEAVPAAAAAKAVPRAATPRVLAADCFM